MLDFSWSELAFLELTFLCDKDLTQKHSLRSVLHCLPKMMEKFDKRLAIYWVQIPENMLSFNPHCIFVWILTT